MIPGIPTPRFLEFLEGEEGILVHRRQPKGVHPEFFKVTFLDQLLKTDEIAAVVLGGWLHFGIGFWIIGGITIDHPVDKGHVHDQIVSIRA